MCTAAHLHDKVPLIPQSALQPALELRILALELPIAPRKVPQLACNAVRVTSAGGASMQEACAYSLLKQGQNRKACSALNLCLPTYTAVTLL